jgi:hypothetical protein
MIDTSIAAPASKVLSVANAANIAAALGLQALGLYATWVTFGAGITLPLYAVGGLTVLLQHVIAERRVASWSAGE